jgi:hypothetical protein
MSLTHPNSILIQMALNFRVLLKKPKNPYFKIVIRFQLKKNYLKFNKLLLHWSGNYETTNIHTPPLLCGGIKSGARETMVWESYLHCGHILTKHLSLCQQVGTNG